jgi:hypothetical protein
MIYLTDDVIESGVISLKVGKHRETLLYYVDTKLRDMRHIYIYNKQVPLVAENLPRCITLPYIRTWINSRYTPETWRRVSHLPLRIHCGLFVSISIL